MLGHLEDELLLQFDKIHDLLLDLGHFGFRRQGIELPVPLVRDEPIAEWAMLGISRTAVLLDLDDEAKSLDV